MWGFKLGGLRSGLRADGLVFTRLQAYAGGFSIINEQESAENADFELLPRGLGLRV